MYPDSPSKSSSTIRRTGLPGNLKLKRDFFRGGVGDFINDYLQRTS